VPLPYLLTLYLVLCLVVGYTGRSRVVGFCGMFTLSLLLTPLLMGLILLISAPKKQPDV
jgi:hypothetical protein